MPTTGIPAPPRQRNPLPIILVAAAAGLVILVGLGIGAYVLNLGPLKDSGLTACQQFHDTVQAADSADSSDDADVTFTVDQYHTIRKMFNNSRYSDIRGAGTKLIDLLWQLVQMDKDPTGDSELGTVLLLGGQFVSAYSSLAGACSNHGIDIPPLSEND